jgi:hypothetical protein
MIGGMLSRRSSFGLYRTCQQTTAEQGQTQPTQNCKIFHTDIFHRDPIY